jgi:hypothetical protein
MQMKIPAAMAAINANPPITPPTIGPTEVELLEGVIVAGGVTIVVVENIEDVGDELDRGVFVVVLVINADDE